MAARPVWRGHLRLALVSCPVALETVHQASAGLHFHFINPATGNRVRQVTVDADTDEELNRGALARGFEYEKGRHVVLDDDDFERARVDSSSLLVVDKFVPANAIDPIFYDTSYFVTPDGDAGGGLDVYAVLRDAIARAGKVALSRLVISRRERAVALHPLGRGLVLHTLFDAAEVASADEAFSTVPAGKPDPAMIDLARQLIDRQTGRFDPADLADRYEARLREVIEAKIAGEEPEPPPGARDDGNKVVDLMAALRRSLGQDNDPPVAKKAATARKAKGAAGAANAVAKSGPKAAPKSAPKSTPKSAPKPAPARRVAATGSAAKRKRA